MAFESWDIEAETTYTDTVGRRTTVGCPPRVVGRHGTRGRFATLREAQEYLNGRLLYRGRYRTREELYEHFRNSPEWRGAQVERTATGWHFRLGTAELTLRAA